MRSRIKSGITNRFFKAISRAQYAVGFMLYALCFMLKVTKTINIKHLTFNNQLLNIQL